MASVTLEALQGQLQRFSRVHYGGEATVRQTQVMPGHAGLSFGFRVLHEKEGSPCEDSLVLRLPPKGVRQSGNTDVLRQAPLLQALRRNRVPVPADSLIALCEAQVGRKVEDIVWYRAMAGYRFGVITGFNVMLHRRGKRLDPACESLALSVPALFGRAREMLLSL